MTCVICTYVCVSWVPKLSEKNLQMAFKNTSHYTTLYHFSLIPSLSLSLSFPHSLPHSLTPSLPSLTPSLPPSLSPSLLHSLPHSPLAVVLTPCLLVISSSSDPNMEFRLSMAVVLAFPGSLPPPPPSCAPSILPTLPLGDDVEGSKFERFAMSSSSSLVAVDDVIPRGRWGSLGSSLTFCSTSVSSSTKSFIVGRTALTLSDGGIDLSFSFSG